MGARMNFESTAPAATTPSPKAMRSDNAVCARIVIVLTYAALTITAAPLNGWAAGLTILALVTSHFVVVVPGQTATVSASEVFVFASVMLFGPAPAIFTVALAGLTVSLQHRHRTLYRTIFNVTEPALSIFLAAGVFFTVGGVPPFATQIPASANLLVAPAAMALTYFLLNTTLQAAAVTCETGLPLSAAWRPHAAYVAINYYAASSLATIGVRSGTVDAQVVALLLPLLLLSYGMYRVATARVRDAQAHVRELEERYEATVETLAIAVDAKDRVTHVRMRCSNFNSIPKTRQAPATVCQSSLLRCLRL